MLKKISLLEILIFLVFLTSSFDIFLSINLFGYTFRFCQMISFILMIIALFKIIKEKKVIKPLGIIPLLLWLLTLIISTFNTPLINVNIAYDLWLIFNIVFIFSILNIFKEEIQINNIIKLYLISFVIVSIYGLLQFILPFFGIVPPFIAQWWKVGTIARINGFSYEPSYFSTYILMGWIILRIFLKYENTQFKKYKKYINIGFVILSLAMVLSSSRIGILMIVFFEILNLIYDLIICNSNRKQILKIILTIVIIGLIITLILFLINKYVYNLMFLLNGTGLFGTSSHSFSDRFKGMTDTLIVFSQSPLIGHGLGGVYTAVAQLNGFNIYLNSVQDVGIVQNIFAEVLAASGVFGFIFFIKYLFDLIYKPLYYSYKKIKSKKRSIILRTFSISLIFELLILIFNQNILRPYLWIHISLLCLIYEVYRRKYEKK